MVDGEGSYKGPWAAWEGEKEEGVEELEEDAEEWRQEKKRREELQAESREKMKKAGEEKSIFHGEPPPAVDICQILSYTKDNKRCYSGDWLCQANPSPTTPAEPTCTSPPTSASTSSQTKIPPRQKALSLRLVCILG